MDEPVKLKPCPFCLTEEDTPMMHSEVVSTLGAVYCSNCGATGPRVSTRREGWGWLAVEMWNDRPGDEP